MCQTKCIGIGCLNLVSYTEVCRVCSKYDLANLRLFTIKLNGFLLLALLSWEMRRLLRNNIDRELRKNLIVDYEFYHVESRPYSQSGS